MSAILAIFTSSWAAFASDGRVSVRNNNGEWRAIASGYRKIDPLPCDALLAVAGTLPFADNVRSAAHQAASFAELVETLPGVARRQRIDSTMGHLFILAGRQAQRVRLYFFGSDNDFQLRDWTAPDGCVSFYPGVPVMPGPRPTGYLELVRAACLDWRRTGAYVTPATAVSFMRVTIHDLASRAPSLVSDEFFCNVLEEEAAPVQQRIEHSLDTLHHMALGNLPNAPPSPFESENGNPETRPFVRSDTYHSSAVREPATVARTGDTTSASFVTVSQFDIELSPVQSAYKAKNLTLSVAGGVRPSSSSGAGSASNVAGAGVDWANPSNALGSDNAYATAAIGASGGSDYLRIDFDFSGAPIPGGAVLKGFELTIERSKTGSGDIEDNSIRLQENGTAVGNDKFASGVLWPSSDGDALYGGQGDLWNAGSISVADLNNGIIGCLIQAAETGGASAATARVDAVSLRVYYDEFVAEARVKIGAQVSSVLSVTGPTTSAGPEDRDVTGLTPGATITVEVQGRMVAGGGTVTAAIDQKRMTPQHRDHFAL